ncbi:2-isopropylmalate synthase [Streptomyces sp. NPDC005955]|uniref:2-isopropylmalate synthase n=1 Tax=Streptomyces sp. NPDC005955 TaxID=3364738 RepID=UPI0036A8EBED
MASAVRTTVFPTLHTPSGELPDHAPHWNPQRPSSMPFQRYRPAHQRVPLPPVDRSWPARRIERAPLWVPVDLRDGNQALAEPMDTARKRRLFDLLVTMGFKEIEVGYPSASRTDFDFVRHLVEADAVPDDVTVSVFTAARRDLIDRTVESVEGLPRTLVHLYTATAPTWRDVVLGRSRAEVHALVREAATHLLRRAEERPGADIRFEFSPEVFNLTEPDFVLEVCNGLTDLWEASRDRPVVHNLPATVEIATPNVYADQIAHADRHLARREHVILSVHPHNDRGTGVACAELALLAGAQRVEGCLFGNGERTGNVDLMTLALNLYTQGVDPMLDLSDIDAVREVVEHCNRLPVPDRHPYAGDLVHTAFSGTHQDAIAKGLAHHAKRAAELGVPQSAAPWSVPYLPVDPADIGRTYEAVIRINSQSGKGGVAHLLRVHHGLDLPADLRPDFARAVQLRTDDSGRELSPTELGDLFHTTYVAPGPDGPHALVTVTADAPDAPDAETDRFGCTLRIDGRERSARGDAPQSAVVAALRTADVPVELLAHTGHPVEDGGHAAYARCRVDGVPHWGAGRDPDPLVAAARAVLAAVHRADRARA